MNVISYFNPIVGDKFSKESGELVSIWEHSWSQQGWNPIILNETWAQKNYLYHKLSFNNSNANFYKKILLVLLSIIVAVIYDYLLIVNM